MTERGTTGGRRGRLPEPQVRDRMLRAGVTMVQEAGLTVSLAHLRYEEVIVRADVPRSAGYRAWPTKEEYFDDLLRELAGAAWGGTAAFDEGAVAQAVMTLNERSDLLATPEGRRIAWMVAARESAEENLRRLTGKTQWRTYVTMVATILSLPEGRLRSEVQAILQDSEKRFLEQMAGLYAGLGQQVGFRLRPETGNDFTLIGALGAALVEGLGLRMVLSPDRVTNTFRAESFGPGAPDVWTPVSFALVAIIDSLIEPDPDFDESTVPMLQQQLREQAAAISAAARQQPEEDTSA